MSINKQVDPTTVRLSEHFLLSDLMGCDSVYANGYPNVFDDPTGRKLKEGKALCENVLEPLLDWSRLSISYGYISPDLSRRIVKYQDPNKPSYHRWDAGAACDVTLHDRIYANEPPIHSAFWIDNNLPVSRVITYSESEFICVASRAEEIRKGDHRRALYENRYIGERKPKYIAYSDNPTTRRAQKEAADRLEHDWRGAGYPTYHGGGRKQLQHERTSLWTVLSDFLYAHEAVTGGYPNVAPQRALRKFRRAGWVYDGILHALTIRRLSIVRGYESPGWCESRHNWTTGIYLVVIPPASVKPRDVADAAMTIDGVTNAKVTIGNRVGIEATFGK